MLEQEPYQESDQVAAITAAMTATETASAASARIGMTAAQPGKRFGYVKQYFRNEYA